MGGLARGRARVRRCPGRRAPLGERSLQPHLGQGGQGQRLVLQALARDPEQPISEAYRRRQLLPSDATTRKALRTLVDDELVARKKRGYRIAEPFLAEWIERYES